jgi:hypothetical protein
MWMQVVGKLTLATTPLVNHWWNAAFRFTARGLATHPMSCGKGCTLTAEFDFVSHEVVLRASTGEVERVRLQPRSVAAFHQEVVSALARLGIRITIWTMPVEVESPIRFEDDTVHRAYDPAWAHAFWRALDSMRPVLEDFRAAFVGKSSPVHFFWGSFDLAVSRFSGRRAPPMPDADLITREAYSHEVVSHGFWPGGSGVDEAAFYAYARPEPEGFKGAKVEPAAARYHEALEEFLLPYEAVRTARLPEAELTLFLESTYEQAASAGHWDRHGLER